MSGWPFAPTGERNRLSLITTDGFDAPIPGIVYDGAALDGGVPLGGLGTGYFTLEGTGKIGHVSIYNDIVPPRKDFREWLTILAGGRAIPLSTASISYLGHFPVADLRASFPGVPIEAGIRAFAPFIPGDSASSNVPAALFEIELANTGADDIEVHVQIAPPRPPDGELAAIAVRGSLVGGEPGSLFGEPSPEYAQVESRAIAIPAGESRRLRVSVAWYLPEWRDSSREPHVHRYGQRFASAAEVASCALRDFDVTLAAILAWQGAIYRSDYPGWTRDWLVQSLYSLATIRVLMM